jgi:DNA gyrase subunit A
LRVERDPEQLRMVDQDMDGLGNNGDPTGAGGASGATASDSADGGRVVDTDIARELKDSYLTYAMSTIMDRALPDVRDGLKPSQRRILVAMNDLKLRPNRKHLKCAKIAGNTSGDYHPHGESVIYPTLVGMAQKWKMRTPLIDPQGNFGSIEGDPPAAMRYTEARMTHAAVDMLADLEFDTVDVQPNYDDRLTEPMVLPGRFPNLLVNGGMGIAVGMATSLPPHNPTEVLDAIVRVIENPSISLGELMTDQTGADGSVFRHGIKGPDFPTGGVIMGRAGIVEAYASGRGRVTVRGECHVEQTKSGRDQIVIDRIPYGLGQNGLVEKIVEGVKEERLENISDVRNESGREAQTRIVIELKKGADPNVVERQLYEHTPLRQTFSIINIALVNRRPRTLGLRELIDCYIAHRVEVIRRRTSHLLREAKKRAHLLEGLIYAVCDIDEVIRIIRASSTREEAIQRLMDRRFRVPPSHPYAPKLPHRLLRQLEAAEQRGGISLTRVQAERIGEMRLIQLTGLEIEKLTEEYRKVVEEIERYERILGDQGIVLSMIRDDCAEMRARYASDRLTSIEDAQEDIDIGALIQEHDVAVTISHAGYAKRVPLDTYRTQHRGGKGIIASDAKDDDFIEHLFVASTHDDLLCFTNTGRVFKKRVFELPEMNRTAKGRSLVNLLELREGEACRAFLTVKNFESSSQFLTFVSEGGIVKRTALKEYRNVNRGGIIAVGLKEGDSLLAVTLTDGNDDILLATAGGMAIRFNEQDARLMGRAAAGVKGIELDDADKVIGVVPIPMVAEPDGATTTRDPSLTLLTVTKNGYGKRTAVDEYRVAPESGRMYSQTRGGKGRADIKTSERNGLSVAAIGVLDNDGIVVVTKGGQLVRLPASSISTIGRGTQGVRVVSLHDGDEAVAVAKVEEPVEGSV